jgi:hypothetical protein
MFRVLKSRNDVSARCVGSETASSAGSVGAQDRSIAIKTN